MTSGVSANGQLDRDLDGRLVALVRKDLVRPELGQLAGEDGYRFRHLLIRDAAYEALPKANEQELNLYGYQLMNDKDLAGAIAVFRRNVAEHPDSWNVHDSLGEGLAAAGETAAAIAAYEKALSMAPDAQKARIEGILGKLRVK